MHNSPRSGGKDKKQFRFFVVVTCLVIVGIPHKQEVQVKRYNRISTRILFPPTTHDEEERTWTTRKRRMPGKGNDRVTEQNKCTGSRLAPKRRERTELAHARILFPHTTHDEEERTWTTTKRSEIRNVLRRLNTHLNLGASYCERVQNASNRPMLIPASTS